METNGFLGPILYLENVRVDGIRHICQQCLCVCLSARMPAHDCLSVSIYVFVPFAWLTFCISVSFCLLIYVWLSVFQLVLHHSVCPSVCPFNITFNISCLDVHGSCALCPQGQKEMLAFPVVMVPQDQCCHLASHW